MVSIYDLTASGLLPLPPGSPTEPGGGLMGSYGDLMRQQQRQKLFGALTQAGAGLIQAGMGGPYGSQQQGIGQAFQGFQNLQADPMDLMRARYMEAQIRQMEEEPERRIREDVTGRPRYEDTGELVYPNVTPPAQPRETRTVTRGGTMVTEEFDPNTGEWSVIGSGPRWQPPQPGKPDRYDKSFAIYKAAGYSDAEADALARKVITEDVTDPVIDPDLAQRLNLPLGTTESQVRGRMMPPPGTTAPPSAATPPLVPPPPAPVAAAPGIPPAPPAPEMPVREQPMENIAAKATGLWSAVGQGLENVAGGVFRSEELFGENSALRNDLEQWRNEIRRLFVNNPKFPVAELAIVDTMIPSPNDWMKAPGDAIDEVSKLRSRLETKLESNRVSLQTQTLSDKERQRLLDQNADLERGLATFGPKPAQGSRFSPHEGISPEEARNLPAGDWYRGRDGKLRRRGG